MTALLCHHMGKIHARQITEDTLPQDLVLGLLSEETTFATISILTVTSVEAISNQTEDIATAHLHHKEVEQDFRHLEDMGIAEDHLHEEKMTMKLFRSSQTLLG